MATTHCVLIEFIAEMPVNQATVLQTIWAFSKLLWIQNDFITRQYP